MSVHAYGGGREADGFGCVVPLRIEGFEVQLEATFTFAHVADHPETR